MDGDLVDRSHVLEGRWDLPEEQCSFVDLFCFQFVLFRQTDQLDTCSLNGGYVLCEERLSRVMACGMRSV